MRLVVSARAAFQELESCCVDYNFGKESDGFHQGKAVIYFSAKDLGILRHYLGMDIDYCHEEGKVILSRGYFVSEILIMFHMEAFKPSHTLMDAIFILEPHFDEETKITDAPYRQFVGIVMYVML